MAKRAILLAAAVFGVLLVVATAHKTTTVTTVEVEDEEENDRRRVERCDEQIRKAQQLNHCQYFLREESETGGPYERGSHGIMSPEESDRDDFKQCCRQLRQVEDERCRCEALREFVRREGQFRGGEESRQLAEKARQLPQLCGLEGTCQQIRALDF